MNILLCNYEYPPIGGGGGIVSAWLAQDLAKRHEVTVLTSQIEGTPAERIEDGVRVLRVPVFFRNQRAVANMASMVAYVPMGILKGRKLLRWDQFDVVNTHFVVPTGPVGYVISRQANIPNVLSLHGGDVYDPSKFTSPHRHYPLRVTVRWLLRQADAIVGQSTNTIANISTFYCLEKDAERIPLGIPRVPQDTASRCDYGFAEDDILLVSVGRLVARKNIGQLIDMVKALADERVHLLIVGTGPEDSNLRERVAQQEVADSVHFLGYVDDAEKFRILNMADVFVSSSRHEGFGIGFLEAMACGLPIICYDYGGQTDFLEHEVNGYVLPVGDIEQFTEHCRVLVEQPELRIQFGQVNRQAIESYFIDNCARRYEKVFTDAIQRRVKQKKMSLPQQSSTLG
jgi:glycosyltransferase involved in cell wall biosynthesis